ncbi:glycosyltransferase [Aeromonas sp. FDAARGOS 1408]|uniref:glycosyltransferase n=1 Tax=Aeromonas TaxID=642 RepID=UPI001C227B65|nr:glycosyltransferase [Aeromonas sp. FDAARGOS 1408]QXC06458.1 glycosyltransferase [Aeromonas sp. FDAARGOS 1408]
MKNRVLWLLNHSTLRSFEIPQLIESGIEEIYLPKKFPYDEGNLSASITFDFDDELTIPRHELDVLNEQNWYESPSKDAWDIVNKYFDYAIIGFFPKQIKSTIKNFNGAVILRVFGLSKGYNYSSLLRSECGDNVVSTIKSMGKRFWFGCGYEHISDVEMPFLAKRSCYLPVGLKGKYQPENWSGKRKTILFVCPRIGTSPYFKNIYDSFVRDFKDFDYIIGGAQPIAVNDKKVLGFVSKEEHSDNMQECSVMFYHSTEPNHIHYHPFEAIQAGMPLVYMAGGMLDLMGGVNLPGRCETIAEAKAKIGKILNGDEKLIRDIRKTQHVLLEQMMPEHCASIWKSNFSLVIDGLKEHRLQQKARPAYVTRKKRIAVIVPIEYRGGSLRGAKLLADAILLGSQQANEDCEVVFAHPAIDELERANELQDLNPTIQRRGFYWQNLSKDDAARAMQYAGHDGWCTTAESYMVPNDGISNFYDCDMWVFVSDRLAKILLPVRPIVLMVYDYLQRYVSILQGGADHLYLKAATQAERVLVTTDFTCRDAQQYAGIEPDRIARLPMLAPDFSFEKDQHKDLCDYFIWTTNLSPHKNHLNAVKALDIYYNQLAGSLKCFITGVNTQSIMESKLSHLSEFVRVVENSKPLKRKIKLCGELSDIEYRKALKLASFIWHPARIDNGTFSVIEAAYLEVPALSSDYPAMREIDSQFSLNLTWSAAESPQEMAQQLKYMEEQAVYLREKLPSKDVLEKQQVHHLAKHYWGVIRECL